MPNKKHDQDQRNPSTGKDRNGVATPGIANQRYDALLATRTINHFNCVGHNWNVYFGLLVCCKSI